MQLSCPFLKLIDAPLDLREVSLGVRFKDSDSFDQIGNLYLLSELIEASLEHAILRTVLTQAPTASRQKALAVQCE